MHFLSIATYRLLIHQTSPSNTPQNSIYMLFVDDIFSGDSEAWLSSMRRTLAYLGWSKDWYGAVELTKVKEEIGGIEAEDFHPLTTLDNNESKESTAT